MYKNKSNRKTLLVIAGLAVFLMACGLINQVVEQIGPVEALVEDLVSEFEDSVEAPVIVDEPVERDEIEERDEPAETDQPEDAELPSDFVLYPGAEFFHVADAGGSWAHLYLTDDSEADVQAFYQSEYPYLIFRFDEPCTTWEVDDDNAMQVLQELIGIGVVNFWICPTDEMGFMIDAMMAEEDIGPLPENMTLILIWTTDF